MGTVVVAILGEIELPHFFLEEVDDDEIKASNDSNAEEEENESTEKEFQHLMINALDEEIVEGYLNFADSCNSLLSCFLFGFLVGLGFFVSVVWG